MGSRLEQLSSFEFAAAGNTKLGINKNHCFNGVSRGYDDGRELLRITALDMWHGVLLLLIINSTCHNAEDEQDKTNCNKKSSLSYSESWLDNTYMLG